MERSRKILQKIVSASQQVIAAANEYADRKGLFNVEHAHIQLEEEMQRVAVACECLASIIPTSLLQSGPSFDERIKDWVTSNEPRTCYETLEQMAGLLREDTCTRPSTSLTGRGTTTTKDKIEEAVNLFDLHKPYFHFLFNLEIWNNQGRAQEHHDATRIRGVPQHSPEPVQVDSSTTLPEMVVSDHGSAARTRRRETKVDETKMMSDQRKLDGILKWLDGLNCAGKQDVTLSLRQPDTCKWLFDTTQYKSWRDGESSTSFLWLRGKAGAGKSVWASSVIDSLEENPRDGEFLVYFYCDFRNERSTHAAEAMRSILFQLLRQLRRKYVDSGCCIDDLIKAKERGGATLNSAKQLAGFVSRVARSLAQKPLVIVDALDECKNVRELLQSLMIIKDCARLLVASRPLHAIADELSGLPFVSMEDTADKLSADIELHVARELDARQRLRDLDTEFKAEIRSLLCKKADGMFRWVQCSIDALNRCVTRKEVRITLDRLPEGLDETYERILLAIDANSREGQLARRALIWLVVALRPLRLDELMEGLSINLRTRTLDSDLRPMHNGALLDACGSLVTYIEKTGIITLSHSTVKEYLMGELTKFKLSLYHVNSELAHLHVARSCMCYISICLNHLQMPGCSGKTPADATGVSSERWDHPYSTFQPLRDYVLDHAPDHFSHLGPKIKSLLPDINILQRDVEMHSTAWDNLCLSASRVMGRTTPCWPTARHDLTLYILVAFSPNSVLRAFLHRTRLMPKGGTNPLVYAACFNRHEHAETLLSCGARLNQIGWVPNQFCRKLPLEVALITFGCHDVATVFVREGSPVPLRVFGEMFSNAYPLDPIPFPLGKMLLQTDDFMEVVDDPMMTLVLSSPAAFGDLLVTSCEEGIVAIIRRITQVTPAIAESCHDAFLRIAIEQRNLGILRALLSLGATLPSDSLSSSNWCDMDLIWEPDTLETVKFLVAHGCNPFQANPHGKTPLQIAIERGHVSVACYLLSLGASFPSHLPDASLWNLEIDSKVICLLAEHGGSTLAHKDGGSLLHIALQRLSEHDSLETLKLLVAHGCNPSQANSSGKTPMRITIERGHVSVAHHLLSLGVPLPFGLPNISVFGGQLETTSPRAEPEGDAHTHIINGGSLLHTTLGRLPEHKSLEIAKFLIAHGCDPFQANSHGETTMHIAIQRGHTSVTRYLLSLGVPLPFDWLNMFFWGLEYNLNAEMICFLVEHGMDALTCTADGDTLLHIAFASHPAELGNPLETAKFLIARGCDPFQANPRGETPLHIAVERGYVSVACYLLSLGVPLPSDLYDILWSSVDQPGMIRFLEDLAGRNIPIPARTKDGDSPLHIALERLSKHNDDSLEMVKFLVTHGCDPFHASSRGKTPLHIAIRRRHVTVARYLLSLGAPLPSDLLDSPSSVDRPEMIRLLAEYGGSTLTRTIDGDSLLHAALLLQRSLDDYNHLETVKFLITRGCDPFQANSCGKTPLHIAIERGHVAVARHLFSLGAVPPSESDLLDLSTVSYDGEMLYCLAENGVITGCPSPVFRAAMYRIRSEDEVLEATRFLLAQGGDPQQADSYGETPIRIAIHCGHASVAQFLLSLGVPLPADALFIALQPQVFCRYPRDSSPRNLKTIIPFLVDQGANIHARRSNGDTVLHAAVDAAAASHDPALVKFLVACGCDPALANADGVTPLHVAVKLEDAELVEQLLSLNAPLPPDILFTAISNNHIVFYDDPRMQVVEVLVTAGCDILALNEAGHTLLYGAVTRGHVAVVDYLLSVMGSPPSEDLVSAIALAPPEAQDEMTSLLNRCGIAP